MLIDWSEPVGHSEKCHRCDADIRWETTRAYSAGGYWEARQRALSAHFCPTWAYLSEDAY